MQPRHPLPISLAAACAFFFALSVSHAGNQDDQSEQQDDKKPVKTRKLEVADDLATEVPVTWKTEKATSRFRIHQLTLPRAKGDARDGTLIFFHFGKGGGGGLAANLKRWYEMVELAEDEESEEKPKPKEIKSDDAKISWLDLAGTYLDRPAPFAQKVVRRANYRVFAAYIDAGADGPYYLRAYGPDKTMLEHRKAFENMLKGITQR